MDDETDPYLISRATDYLEAHAFGDGALTWEAADGARYLIRDLVEEVERLRWRDHRKSAEIEALRRSVSEQHEEIDRMRTEG